MLTKAGIWVVGALVAGASGLAALAVSIGLATYSAQTSNPHTTLTSVPSRVNTGYVIPSARAADTGGDDDGFELNPTYAFADGPLYATNSGGPGDRQRYYNYGISVPGGSTIDGLRVRLDWWLSNTTGTNSMSVQLSWDGGKSWTAPKTDYEESQSQHTAILGGAVDTWGRVWTVDELSDANFRVRLTCNCSDSNLCPWRSFRLGWVAVNVYYTPP